ncbi:FAD-binding oxidoreductase [Aestuariispira ectoiniformans]|uniref:FAD-binding oxidoreductase n=1 Tax=Aestuariispira ectoiniformans TaxID=2775080 RepID=UPI00223B3DA8|nr:FAD-binding oxidoreductase [Aestuariispira ectoiniformans]
MLNERHIASLRHLARSGKSVLGPEDDLAGYETGARHDKGRAAFVLRPETSEELSGFVAYCVTNGISLIPQSGNTGVVSGSTPDRSKLQGVLSLDRMNTVFDLNLRNRSLRVGAGMRLSEVNARLEEHGLFFPVDLSADPMIGGMIATNTGGGRFLRYGDVRANTLGLKAVLADDNGSILDLNKGLRKNNTGVDWKQVFIGTVGTFGIVTEAVLNLEPLPRQSATALVVPGSDDAVFQVLASLERKLGPQLSAFESMSGNAMRHAFDHAPSLRNPFANGDIPDLAILVEATRTWEPREGEISIDDLLEACLAEIWEEPGEPLADALVGRPEEIWALRHSISEGVKNAGHLFAFDLAFERGILMDFLAYMHNHLPDTFPDLEICDFGHIGDGGVHFNLSHPGGPPADLEAYEKRLRDWVIDICVNEFDGSFSAEHGIGRKNQAYYDQYTPDAIKKLSRALKQVTSPGPLGSVHFD